MTKTTPEARRALRRQAQQQQAQQQPQPAPIAAPGAKTKVTRMGENPEKASVQIPGGTVTSVSERVPRLPCPECRFVISLSLYDLMTAPNFTCPRCQTTLNLLRGESSEALKHVQNFYVAMKDHERLG